MATDRNLSDYSEKPETKQGIAEQSKKYVYDMVAMFEEASNRLEPSKQHHSHHSRITYTTLTKSVKVVEDYTTMTTEKTDIVKNLTQNPKVNNMELNDKEPSEAKSAYAIQVKDDLYAAETKITQKTSLEVHIKEGKHSITSEAYRRKTVIGDKTQATNERNNGTTIKVKASSVEKENKEIGNNGRDETEENMNVTSLDFKEDNAYQRTSPKDNGLATQSKNSIQIDTRNEVNIQEKDKINTKNQADEFQQEQTSKGAGNTITKTEQSESEKEQTDLKPYKKVLKGNKDGPTSDELCSTELQTLEENNTQNSFCPKKSSKTCIDLEYNEAITFFMNRIGLDKYYPNKLELMNVMKIIPSSDISDAEQIVSLFVKNLIMVNFTCRDKIIQNYIEKINMLSCKAGSKQVSLLPDDLLSDDDDDDLENEKMVNPLDITVGIFKCSSPVLQQILATKLFMCKLAIPFVFPAFYDEEVTLCLWPLRSITMECKTEKGLSQKMSVDCPCHVVSFIRLGRPSVSKSKLLNEILTDQYHHTFFNKDCPLGTSKRCLSNGLVEATWYLPSNKSNILNNLTMFFNLRGDGLNHKTQLKFLSQVSTVLVIMIDINALQTSDWANTLKELHSSKKGIVLAVDANQSNKKDVRIKLQAHLDAVGKLQKAPRVSILKINGEERSISMVKSEIRNGISELVKDVSSMPLINLIKSCDLCIKIDEDMSSFKRAKEAVRDILSHIPKNSRNVKKNTVPLQGKPWRTWSEKQKEVCKTSQHISLLESGKIKKQMEDEREKQFQSCQKLSSVMSLFLSSLEKMLSSKNDSNVFVSWLKLCLDDITRADLPEYLSKYQSDWQALKTARAKKDEKSIIKLRTALDKSEYNLAEASFGFEHLCREMGQIYQALQGKKTKEGSLGALKEKLPHIAATLLIMGQPFEIMDGDAANVPLTWVKAVLKELHKKLGDKRLLALSVLGIQSSGKSTFLNTMFGLQFAVSAGRCTRGVFMQLVPVKDKRRKFDFVLVIDTEGLRAPELAHQKYSHDNELATFVIGLGDITIINIKGENTAEMKDVLQIAVHAFLRLKLANTRLNLKQSCLFVHQNVPASDATDKMVHGRQKLVEVLDAMATEAAEQVNIADINSFNQVIEFDSEKNVWYFSDLWHGDPPMAPANPGYSESVSNVKDAIISRLSTKRETYLTITDTLQRIDDLWNGILKDDFVFSFRNSLELKAYNCMEQQCQIVTWKLEKHVFEFVISSAKNSLINCKNQDELEMVIPVISSNLHIKVGIKVQSITKELEEYVEKSTLKEVMIQWIQSKRNRFKLLGENLALKALTQINNMKEEIRIKKLQSSEKTRHEMEINELARQMALEMRGTIPSDEVLENKFNTLWISWINKFEAKEIGDVVSIRDQINAVLCEKFVNDAAFLPRINAKYDYKFYKHIDKLEGTVKYLNIYENHLNMLNIRKGWFPVWNKEKKISSCLEQAIEVTDMIFRQIDANVEKLQSQDTRFDISYVTEILSIVSTEIAKHNAHKDNDYKFNILPTFRALIATHVVRYITVVFSRLNDDYISKHSPKAQIEQYKGTARAFFKNMVEKKTEDVIAVGFFREVIFNSVNEHLADVLPIDTQDHIQLLFPNGKCSLIREIMTEIATDDFEPLKKFIQSPTTFAEKWIMDLMKHKLFKTFDGGIKIYAKLAKSRITTIFSELSDCVYNATEECCKGAGANITQWIETFVNNNNKYNNLPLSKDDFVHVQRIEVSDFSNFMSMLHKELESIKRDVFCEFEKTDESTIRWKINPVVNIMMKLWGCSELCMFCKEPCMNTDKDHWSQSQKHPHQCLQHRPQGIGGFHWTGSDKLCIEFCNHWVGTEQDYFWTEGGKEEKVIRKYKDYKSHFPGWDIPPNSDVSKYWMWVMCKHQNNLAKMYDVQLPDIPEDWRSITKEKAVESLGGNYKI